MWSSPDFDSSSLSLVLRTKVKKVQHKRMVIKNSFVTKDQNVKQKSKRNRNSLRICRKQIMGVAKHGNHSDKPGKIDRKIDLLMGELRKYGVSVAGIQETKWFGKDVWPVGRYTFLHSGRPLPGDQERASRNEGVGIALDEKATVAWKNAGEVWEAVSSRIIFWRSDQTPTFLCDAIIS